MSKDDIPSPTIGTIARVVNETLGQGDDQEVKPVMYFSAGITKPMVINNTNWMNVEAVYGDESDNWTGNQIEVWVDPSVAFGGKRIGGLRLRVPQSSELKSANGDHLSKLWQRWNELVTEAGQFKVKVPALDADASEADIISAGKALAQAIAEAKAF